MDITQYTVFDLPVPYKTIKIYPATVKDYMLFNTYSQCFLLDKNSIPDPKIISMTELEYLYNVTEKEGKPYLIFFDRLLSICLRDEKSFEDVKESMNRYKFDEKRKPFFIIENEIYTPQDFDEIKKIISEQNLIDLPDENMSKEVRDSLEKAREYKNKMNGAKPASFEDYIVSLSVATGWNLDYIRAMSVRKFTKSIRRLDNLIHYKIYLAASIAGFTEFKDKSIIKHWLTNLDEDKYADVSISLDAVKSTISMESAKK
jgi:hypothetical protein